MVNWQSSGTLKIIETCDSGVCCQLGNGKVVFLSHEDIAYTYHMYAFRSKFEEDWPLLWMLRKMDIPMGPIEFRNTPRTQEGALIEDPADIYFLTKVDLLQCGNIQDLTADKLLIAIENSKCRPLGKIIFALGIPHVGREWADKLAQEFSSIDALGRATWEDLTSIPGLGVTIALSILEWFHTEGSWKMIEKLRLVGVQLEIPSTEDVSITVEPLARKTFMFTGRLETLTRSKARALIEGLGGIAGSAVSKNTDYLVVGDKPGSKLDRAIALDIPRISEEELYELIQKKEEDAK